MNDFDPMSPQDGATAPEQPAWRRDPGGPWLTTEIALLRAVYPAGGAGGVRAQLPHRTLASIRAKASSERIKCTKANTAGLRFARIYQPGEQVDQAIREGYIHANGKGAIKALAARVGRPAWWVQKRGSQLGVTRTNRTRVDGWTAPELAILEDCAHMTHKYIARKLRDAGFVRTESAVSVKLKRLHLDREDPDRWTATALAPFFGVNPKTIADWIERRSLPAKRESWGPNGRLMVDRKALRKWVASTCATIIDLRRVDQPWFKELMWGPA